MSPRRPGRGWLIGGGAALLVAAAAIVVVLVSSSGSGRPGPAPGARPASPARPALPAPDGLELGASVNRLFNDGTDSRAQIAVQLQALHAAGADLARSDALWEATEPAAPTGAGHHYDWTFDDAIAGALATAHLAWLPILDYSAPWAQSVPGQDHSPPRSDADYAAYAGAFAARYGAGGSFWTAHPELGPDPVTAIEIWNEPDNAEFWSPAPDPARYAGLYAAARAAIDAADPAIRVLVGGLVSPARFLPAMLRADPSLAGHVDGVAIHPYGAPAAVLARLRGARSALRALGMGQVPLYVTEFGWTTSPPGAQDYVPRARRPGDIERTLAALGHTDCGVAAALLYTWVTPQRDPGDSGDWFGIHAPSGADTADSRAFAAGLAAARAPGATQPICGS